MKDHHLQAGVGFSCGIQFESPPSGHPWKGLLVLLSVAHFSSCHSPGYTEGQTEVFFPRTKIFSSGYQKSIRDVELVSNVSLK